MMGNNGDGSSYSEQERFTKAVKTLAFCAIINGTIASLLVAISILGLTLEDIYLWRHLWPILFILLGINLLFLLVTIVRQKAFPSMKRLIKHHLLALCIVPAYVAIICVMDKKEHILNPVIMTFIVIAIYTLIIWLPYAALLDLYGLRDKKPKKE